MVKANTWLEAQCARAKTAGVAPSTISSWRKAGKVSKNMRVLLDNLIYAEAALVNANSRIGELEITIRTLRAL